MFSGGFPNKRLDEGFSGTADVFRRWLGGMSIIDRPSMLGVFEVLRRKLEITAGVGAKRLTNDGDGDGTNIGVEIIRGDGALDGGWSVARLLPPPPPYLRSWRLMPWPVKSSVLLHKKSHPRRSLPLCRGGGKWT
ncbi:hypothetical protein GGI06_004555 [Coemansia sp. S85]|nr:hypothetical protein GGI06_004555 [Coemansia sp. S85]